MKKKILAWVLSVAMVFSVFPIQIFAVEAQTVVGDLTVIGGTLDEDFTYVDNTLTILKGTELTISGTTIQDHIVVASGIEANLTLNNLDISFDDGNYNAGSQRGTCAFEVLGTATITLATGSENTLESGDIKAGLQVNEGAKVSIKGDGKLNAFAGEGAPGIGGGDYKKTGEIYIHGGTITAQGARGGAGIGGGPSNTGGIIKIYGGTIEANGDFQASGIGGGSFGDGGDIYIQGGTITATGSSYGAGIGAGADHSGGTICIKNGIITATGGDKAAGIGGSSNGTYGGDGGDIRIEGGTITAIGKGGAGIGGGYHGNGGTIYIGGYATVTAIADDGYGSAAIGGGYCGDGGDISIKGAFVNADGGEKGTGIGGHGSGENGTLTVGYSSNYSIIKASSIEDQSNKSSWNGIVFEGKEGFVYGMTRLDYLLTIESDETLTINPGKSLTIYNYGLSNVLTNNGTLINNGEIRGETELKGDGVFKTEVFREECIYDIPPQIYTGDPIEPEVKIGLELFGKTFDVDSTGVEVSYKNNTEVGTATVEVTKDGKVVEKTFEIVKSIGDLIVEGGVNGKDFSYKDGVLTVLTDKALTISGTTITDRIVVAADVEANITLAGVDIQHDDGGTYEGTCAFEVLGTANITLAGGTTNTLKSGSEKSGLQVEKDASLQIYGTGTLNATGGKNGAGIGGGYHGDCGNITINGGTVTATAGEKAAGIGGGEYGSAGSITINGGTVTATAGEKAAGIGSGYHGDGGNITINDGTVIATGGVYGAGIGSGSYGNGGNITISGGTVTATGGEKAAGIGGGNECYGGNITISGGEVNTTGGVYGAGIGGGAGYDGGTTTITGGTVTAKGGQYGAGIGGSADNDGGNITISGGEVTAIGNNDSAGIGGGAKGRGGTFITGEDGNAIIKASSIEDQSHKDEWECIVFIENAGVVYGTQTLVSDLSIVSGETLTVANGSTLTVGDGITLTNEGKLVNNGTLKGEGTGTLAGEGIFEMFSAECINDIPDQKYTGNAITPEFTVKFDETVIMGKTFTVSSEDYTRSYENNVNAGEASIVFTKADSENDVVKTFNILGTETEFVGGVKTYKDDVETKDFEYSDIITVKVTPQIKQAQNSPMMAMSRSFAQPIANQMALFAGETQITEPQEVSIGTELTFEINTTEFLKTIGTHTITAKYVGGDNMSSYEESVTITLSAYKGDFIVTGGEIGVDYTYEKGTLTILTGKALTIKNADPNTATTEKIVGAEGVDVNITLAGVNIKNNDGDDFLEKEGTCALEIFGTANITLADDTVNILISGSLKAGLQVQSEGTLKIYGTGTLNATGGYYGAGIGSGGYGDGGSIIINNGIINATAGYSGAGIGCGVYGDGGSVTINNGTVTAQGGGFGTGIGGGYYSEGGSVTINDGTINATGGVFGAGIGGGYYGECGNIEISGGTVTATGGQNGAGIGGGSYGECGNIEISGGTVTAIGGKNGAGIGGGCYGECGAITISGGKVTATGGASGAGIGSGTSCEVGNITISDGKVTATGGEKGAGIGGGYNGECGNIEISGGTVDATGGLNGAGIGSGNGSSAGTITISAGTVTAQGGENGAGIGGGYGSDGGTITINNGTVTATGGENGAGIGGGSGINNDNGDGGTIIINNGTVTAIGGEFGAGIGGGDYGNGANITINNGTVTATGNSGGAGIGGGYGGSGNYIKIDDGKVTATGGEFGAGIGGGNNGNGGVVIISSGTVDATGRNYGAGIGGGNNGNGGSIEISGGTVTAKGDNGGAGIGSGLSDCDNTSAGDITITGGTVDATGGASAAGIGGGQNSAAGIVIISSGTVTAKGGGNAPGIGGSGNYDSSMNNDFVTSVDRYVIGNAIIRASSIEDQEHKEYWEGIIFEDGVGFVYGDQTLPEDLTIESGETLTIDVGINLTIPSEKVLTNDGTLIANGTLEGEGTLAGNGTFKTDIFSEEDITDIPDQMHTGEEIKPDVTVNDTRDIMEKAFTINATGWEAGYEDNIEIGEATATLTKDDVVIRKAFNIVKPYLIVTGGEEGTDYTYIGELLTILTDKELTISGSTTTDKILVPTGVEANITLAGVDIKHIGESHFQSDIGVFEVLGTANITLADGTINTLQSGYGKAGLQVQSGATVTIGGTGTLNATGGYSGAGIGGGYNGDGGNITINGGTVTATGGDSGAGIGGGDFGDGGNITINGGTVNATGGYSASGIGGGKEGSNGGDITIIAGTVTANGYGGGAGIGSGTHSTGGNITITGGEVTANGYSGGAGIGGGSYSTGGNGGNVKISGGTVTANGYYGGGAGIGNGNQGSGVTFTTGEDGNAIIKANSIGDKSDKENWKGIIFERGVGFVYGDQTLSDDLTIKSGETLTIDVGINLTIPSEKVLTNDGTLINNGTLEGAGTLDGQGTFRIDILSEKDIANIPDQQYTGEEVKPNVTINATRDIMGIAFTLNKAGWIVGYEDNIAEGTATATLTKGDIVVRKTFIITSEEIVSVTITWGAMDFTYDEGNWDAETHEYENGSWVCQPESNLITVENNSSAVKKVSLDYQSKDNFSEITGKFTDEDTHPWTEYVVSVTEIKKIYLDLIGKPTEKFESQNIGNVTVRIGG